MSLGLLQIQHIRRGKNLNPEPKINLNHANLKPQICWAVASQEFAHFTGISLKSKFHSFHVDRVRRPILWRWQLGRVGRAWRMVAILVASGLCSREWCAALVGGFGQSH